VTNAVSVVTRSPMTVAEPIQVAPRCVGAAIVVALGAIDARSR
jgi:hypothetical protein